MFSEFENIENLSRDGYVIIEFGTENKMETKERNPRTFWLNKIEQRSKDGKELIKTWNSSREIGEAGFNKDIVAKCCKEKAKTHYGFTWKWSLNKPKKELTITLMGKNITEWIRNVSIKCRTQLENVIAEWNKLLEKMELWATIQEYPNCKISNKGIIRNFKTGRILSQRCQDGYKIVSLWNSSNSRVNVLVANYFIPNPENYPLVDHINRDRQDNKSQNLRWVTYVTSSLNRSLPKNAKKVEQWNLEVTELLKIWNSATEASRELKLNDICIRCCCRGEMKTYKQFVWKYSGGCVRELPISEKDIKEDYVEIGILGEIDLSAFKIKKDGTEIINKYGHRMKTHMSGGYERINLRGNNVALHKIANAVLNGEDYKSIVDHKDENKGNNEVNNLEAVTQRENIVRAVGKKICQIDMKTGKELASFNCIIDACIHLGKKKDTGIRLVCEGKRKTAYGYKWRFESGIENLGQTVRKEKLGSTRGRKIRQINLKDGKEVATFNCVIEACRSLGKNKDGGIRLVCDGKRKTAYGFKWEFMGNLDD
jgi:NUMOD4 motif/HNH endonuclease